MHRRIGFVISACGMAFVLLPLARVLPAPDFVVCTIGMGFIIVGVFVAIESLAKRIDQKL